MKECKERPEPDTDAPNSRPSLKHEINISLSFMEAKDLLDVLFGSLHIINRDNSRAKYLFEKIASQLEGAPVIVDVIQHEE